MEIWYRSERFDRAADNEIVAEVAFPGESPWFEGHFPQEPVLPGIAQVAVIHDLIRRTCGQDLPLREISRIRFKRKISPSDRLTITITPKGGSGDAYRFRMTCKDEPVCSGFLKVGSGKEKD
jgi:3-hydroxymyristoyl/3-hydroxydecanoyl-(acyl carrier protein) dehydratase